MRVASQTHVPPRQLRSPEQSDPNRPKPVLRRPVRPLDDATTEMVRVIEFAIPAGSAIQHVLWLDRELLN